MPAVRPCATAALSISGSFCHCQQPRNARRAHVVAVASTSSSSSTSSSATSSRLNSSSASVAPRRRHRPSSLRSRFTSVARASESTSTTSTASLPPLLPFDGTRERGCVGFAWRIGLISLFFIDRKERENSLSTLFLVNAFLNHQRNKKNNKGVAFMAFFSFRSMKVHSRRHLRHRNDTQ